MVPISRWKLEPVTYMDFRDFWNDCGDENPYK